MNCIWVCCIHWKRIKCILYKIAFRIDFLILYFLIDIRYGYVTNTKIKFIIVVDSTNTALRDNEIRSVSNLLLIVVIFMTSVHPENLYGFGIFSTAVNCIFLLDYVHFHYTELDLANLVILCCTTAFSL